MHHREETFRYCCNEAHKIQYNIRHNPKPIDLIPELRDCIEYLLWYVPGIKSEQSYNNFLIDDPLYSEAVFDFVLEAMHMLRKEDVKIVNGNVEERDKTFYENEICTSCQKMILTLRSNYNGTGRKETIIRAMLRHIRNSIAHGNFIVMGNLVFFRDTQEIRNEVFTTAIIKIEILSLSKALKQIEDFKGITQEIILAKIFEKIGFSVEREVSFGRNSPARDMIIKKGSKAYCVEIKEKIKRVPGYDKALMTTAISQLNICKNDGLIPILVYDKDRISKRMKKRLKNEGIILLDRSDVGELISTKVFR